MYFSLILLAICLFIFLFVIFLCTRDDFVLLRRNIAQEQVFNIAILSLLFGLLTARLFYALIHSSEGFFHPLVFLAFPYFPGFSTIGGVIGTFIFLFFYTTKRTIPTLRLFDFFSLAFIPSLFIGFSYLSIRGLSLLMPILYLIVGVIFLIFLIPRHRKGELKDGSVFYLFLISFAIISLLTDFISKSSKIIFLFGTEGIISIIVLISCLVLLIKQENLHEIGNKLWNRK